MVLPVMEHETSRTAAWQWFTLASSIGKSYRHSLEVFGFQANALLDFPKVRFWHSIPFFATSMFMFRVLT